MVLTQTPSFPPAFRDGVRLDQQSPSGQCRVHQVTQIAYRWRLAPRFRRCKARSRQGAVARYGAASSGNPVDQIMYALIFPHPLVVSGRVSYRGAIVQQDTKHKLQQLFRDHNQRLQILELNVFSTRSPALHSDSGKLFCELRCKRRRAHRIKSTRAWYFKIAHKDAHLFLLRSFPGHIWLAESPLCITRSVRGFTRHTTYDTTIIGLKSAVEASHGLRCGSPL